MNLRPYQREAIDSIYRYYMSGKDGNILLVLPTGSGKSVIQAAFVREVTEAYPTERVMLLSHVRELLEQNASKIFQMHPWADVGIYSAGLKCRELGHQVTVAGIQSIYKRALEVGPVSLVIIDEAHLVPKKGEGMYRRFLDELREVNPHLKVIGMSATPYRMDSGLLHEGEGRIFTDVAYDADIRQLVSDGYLCPLISRLGDHRADLGGVGVRGGEFIAGDLERAVDTDELVEGALDEVMAKCADRAKWLFFCAGVDHAQHVRDALERRGVSAACVTGETPADERDRILADFKAGRLRAVTNMNVLTTGFDAPDIDAIIMLRPTLSPGLYVQMVGRGMRPHESKTDTLVLDFAGNILEHGPIDRIRVETSAGGGQGVGTAPMRECPECKELCFVASRACEGCGYEFPKDDTPRHQAHSVQADVFSGTDLETLEVEDVAYALHTKEDRPPSMKVTYYCAGRLLSYSEWICFEHGGYAAKKAHQWWRRRHPGPIPETVSEALRMACELAEPKAIVVNHAGKFPSIIAHHDLVEPVRMEAVG